jgi:hypothetical protein
MLGLQEPIATFMSDSDKTRKTPQAVACGAGITRRDRVGDPRIKSEDDGGVGLKVSSPGATGRSLRQAILGSDPRMTGNEAQPRFIRFSINSSTTPGSARVEVSPSEP